MNAVHPVEIGGIGLNPLVAVRLIRAQVITIDGLCALTPEQVGQVTLLGTAAVRDVERNLARHGRHLASNRAGTGR